MTFKDCARGDICRTFLNTDEFASKIEIDGRFMTASFQTDTLKPENTNPMMTGAGSSPLYSASGKLYCRSFDYGSRPKPGKLICIDGRQYRILAVADECGMFIFDVEAMRA